MATETTLGEMGQILISQAALDTYCDFRGLRPEEARRELTTLLTGATRQGTDPGTSAGGWRIRSRSLGVDVDAHVACEGALAVVTHVHVRARAGKGGRGARERREQQRREKA